MVKFQTYSNNRQKAIIHAAKAQLNISAATYEGMLEGYGVTTSKNLTFNQAESLIRDFEALGFVQKFKPRKLVKNEGRGWGSEKFEYLSNRDPEFATPKQLRMLDAMWRDSSRLKTDDSFQSFIKRMTNIDNIEWISQKHVTILVSALNNMTSTKRMENHGKKTATN